MKSRISVRKKTNDIAEGAPESGIQSRVAQLIEMRNLNPFAFAKKIGAPPSTVSEVVGGRRSEPRATFLEKILLAFPEVSGDWLLTGQGKPFRSGHTATVLGNGNAVAQGQGATAHATLADCEKELAACRAQVQGLQELVASKNETIAALRGSAK